ncbi:MAG: hypothetical protein ACRCZB_10620, partial [Bacteroidales bacterium]
QYFFRTFSKVLTFFVSFFVSRQKMKKAKHGQGGCLSTSWQGIAGRAPIHTQYTFPYGDNTHSAPRRGIWDYF